MFIFLAVPGGFRSLLLRMSKVILVWFVSGISGWYLKCNCWDVDFPIFFGLNWRTITMSSKQSLISPRGAIPLSLPPAVRDLRSVNEAPAGSKLCGRSITWRVEWPQIVQGFRFCMQQTQDFLQIHGFGETFSIVKHRLNSCHMYIPSLKFFGEMGTNCNYDILILIEIKQNSHCQNIKPSHPSRTAGFSWLASIPWRGSKECNPLLHIIRGFVTTVVSHPCSSGHLVNLFTNRWRLNLSF